MTGRANLFGLAVLTFIGLLASIDSSAQTGDPTAGVALHLAKARASNVRDLLIRAARVNQR